VVPVDARGREALTEATAPLYARLAHQHGQDMLVEYRTDRVVEKVVTGPPPAARARCGRLLAGPGRRRRRVLVPGSVSPIPRCRSRTTARSANRVLVFEDRVFVDQIEGLTGRPNSGALGLLFKLIGEGARHGSIGWR